MGGLKGSEWVRTGQATQARRTQGRGVLVGDGFVAEEEGGEEEEAAVGGRASTKRSSVL